MDGASGATSAPLLGEPLPVELMNTIWADRDGLHDALAEPGGVVRWLTAVADRLAMREVGEWAGVKLALPVEDRFRQLRDALRCLAAVATTDERASGASPITGRGAAVAVVNRAAARAPTWSELAWPAGGPPGWNRRARGAPVDAVLSDIADRAVELFAGPDRPLLRACPGPGCVLYFVRNRSRQEWCSDGCGNRARVARHYRRHRGSIARDDQGNAATIAEP